MLAPKYVAVIRVPVYAETEYEAMLRIAPYVRDLQVECEVEIELAEH